VVLSYGDKERREKAERKKIAAHSKYPNFPKYDIEKTLEDKKMEGNKGIMPIFAARRRRNQF
jgi:hypothetical protein